MRTLTPIARPPSPIARGFTLIELTITIAVGSVVVAFMALFIVMRKWISVVASHAALRRFRP